MKNEREIKYEIVNEIGVISEEGQWRLELNRVSWNGREPKYDLRKWTLNHEKMGKGVTLTDDELVKLCDILGQSRTKKEQPKCRERGIIKR